MQILQKNKILQLMKRSCFYDHKLWMQCSCLLEASAACIVTCAMDSN